MTEESNENVLIWYIHVWIHKTQKNNLEILRLNELMRLVNAFRF